MTDLTELRELAGKLDEARDKIESLIVAAVHDRLAAEAKLAEMVKVIEQTQTALRHASFALDGVVALDDEDMGKDGGSDTCQHAKKTVDRALAAVESAIAALHTKQEDRT